jgi:hypothetical protein
MASELSPEAQRLLKMARAGQARAPSAMRARVRIAVLESVASDRADGYSERRVRGLHRLISSKAWLAAVCVAVTALGIYWAGARHVPSRGGRARPAAVSGARKASAAPAPEHVDELPSARPAEDRGATARVREPPSPSTLGAPVEGTARPFPDQLRAEMAWLAQVETALRNHAPERALRALERDRTRFAEGQLVEERQGLELIAQCMLGRSRDIAPAIARYLHSSGSGVLAARVSAACAEHSPGAP